MTEELPSSWEQWERLQANFKKTPYQLGIFITNRFFILRLDVGVRNREI